MTRRTEKAPCRCGRQVERPYATFCNLCLALIRRKPPTWVLTPERDRYLREHYNPRERGTSLRIGRVIGVPAWRVKRWAAELGLCATMKKQPDWTPAEVAFLEEHIGTRSVGWIARALKRSLTAVQVKAKRLQISRRDCRDWYTADALALAMGHDPTTVARWIRTGKLQAERYGENHADGRPAMYRVSEAAVLRFLREHPAAYQLAKVDQVWFLGLVFSDIGGGRRQEAA